uniref:Uncharacterized protein n=1 Tax=Acrobeloides nanus TaxID=290746 RepID=A0A914D0B3_9BILA
MDDEKVEVEQMDVNNLTFDPCLVCASKTKGLHFQVSSCRACAAFFRRATKTKQIFRCQRGTKNCDLTNKMKGRPLCRYCRLKKCKEIGMKLEHDEETKLENPPPSIAVSTASSSIPTFSPSTIASPTTSHLGVPRIEGRKITYDAAPLVQAIKHIFSQAPKSNQYLAYGVRLNFIQQLQCAFSKFLEAVYADYNGTVEILVEFEAETMFRFQEKYLIKLAEMLMLCDQFVELPSNDKFLLFKRFWQVFQGIERIYSTCLYLGNSTNDHRLMLSDKTAIDFRLKDFKMKGMPVEMIEQMMKYFEPMIERSLKFLIIPAKAMRLTQFEIVYLAGTVLWTVYDIKGRLSESTIKLAEEMSDQCSNELHNYYVYELKLSNYAARLTKLNKLTPIIEDSIRSKKELTIMSKVFNMFEIDLTDNDELIDISQGRSICRYCRLKRCKELGMVMEEEAEASSPTSENKFFEEPQSTEISTPSSSLEFQAHFGMVKIEGIRIVYDTTPLCEAIKSSLNQGPSNIRLAYGVRLNFMQELQRAYAEFLEHFPTPPNGEVEIWTEFGCETLFQFQEIYLIKLAEMVVKCGQYAELPHHDKYFLFKHFWQNFQFLERIYATSVFLGTSATDLRLLVTNNAAMDMKNKFFSIQGFPQERLEEFKKHLDPINEQALKFLIMPMKTMKLSQFELVYLASICLWTVHEIKGRLSENTIKLAEDMFEQCSNDMHNYYVYEERLSNYATRLAKLNKILMIAESCIKVRKEVTIMAKVFNLFESDFAESDLMEI